MDAASIPPDNITARPKRGVKPVVDPYLSTNGKSIRRVLARDRKKDLIKELAAWVEFAKSTPEHAALYAPELSIKDSLETIYRERNRVASLLDIDVTDDEAGDALSGGGSSSSSDSEFKPKVKRVRKVAKKQAQGSGAGASAGASANDATTGAGGSSDGPSGAADATPAPGTAGSETAGASSSTPAPAAAAAAAASRAGGERKPGPRDDESTSSESDDGSESSGTGSSDDGSESDDDDDDEDDDDSDLDDFIATDDEEIAGIWATGKKKQTKEKEKVKHQRRYFLPKAKISHAIACAKENYGVENDKEAIAKLREEGWTFEGDEI